MALLISDRPLFIHDEYKREGVPFEVADLSYVSSLIERGIARYAVPPRVLYETTSPEQNVQALGEQGITCLCLTRNRRDWIPKAIACYLAQSYSPRELLIVADGEDIRDLVPEREDIRLIQIDEKRTIGEKRNFGVSQARGKYVAHWDDDDFSAPDRLRDQLDRLWSTGKRVTGYYQLDFTDGQNWYRYTGDRLLAPGSSLLYEREYAREFPFRPIQIGEDGEFTKVAKERKVISTATSNGMLTATIHRGNTSPRPVHTETWQKLDRSGQGLSVIIPSKNADNLAKSLPALRTAEPSSRVIIINDGLDARVHVWGYGNTEFVDGDSPFIFSRNINIGIRAAGRDDILILNDDAILKTLAGFSLLQGTARYNPEYGIIAATTNAVGNRNQLPRGIGLREDPRMVCFVAAFVPRRTLDQIGYLDERFTAYGFEDDDFCYRVRRAGLKIGIHDGCFVDHASLKSTFRDSPLKPANLDGGRKIFIEKWGSYPL